ncbi:lanthionine synthetase LanC family protein [Kribbella sp. NPDC026611]|uniref:lanthionine synthetase LanC family protein n=1 Tax=Kribbella sp. NPDC026611 TaxID=3154911 RepID=UPI0033D3B5A1
MSITEPFILPADVQIVAVADLPPVLLAELGNDADGFAITRHGSRTGTSVVDGLTARLLQRFRTPTTIVDAVLEFSGAESLDARETLEASFAVLGTMITDGVLITADSLLAEPIATTLRPGDRLEELQIVEVVHVVIDTEVYRARTDDGASYAVKLARPGSEIRMRALLSHEAEILEVLGGQVGPAVLRLGEFEGRPWLAIAWSAAADAATAAAEHRTAGDGPALLDLVERILEAYAELHARSVLHGDVHPRNVLVDAAGAVTLIDYGLATADGVPAPAVGGVDLFTAPEFAAARLNRRDPGPPTQAAEQYSLAALAVLLLAGRHTHKFSLERDAMLRQLRDEPPDVFDQLETSGLERLQLPLRRALAKDPLDRFASVADFLRSVRGAVDGAALARRPWRHGAGTALVSDVIRRLTMPDALLSGGIEAPTASAMNGAAGFAHALLRIASIRGDGELLAAADLWAERATAAIASPDAFTSADLELISDTLGDRSFYHHEAGVHAVRALVAVGRDDSPAWRSAVEAFVRAARRPCPPLEVAFGRAGLLLGCALLLETPESGTANAGERLTTLGDQLAASIAAEIDRAPAIADGNQLTRLGAAHGWAGWLYALLRWSDVQRTLPSAMVVERLDQLAAMARWEGRAASWPPDAHAPALENTLAASWCNGAAGYVPLWTAAHALLGDDRYLELALAASWSAYEGGEAAPGDLCCGLAGRAYALATMHRHSSDERWLIRARVLADKAAERIRDRPFRRDSLYKGEVGVALLMEELNSPTRAGLPLYEPEGWPE